jgi:hypothetical protein
MQIYLCGKRLTIFVCLFLLSFKLFPQKLTLNTLCSLPKILNESSGLIQQDPNYLWSHNDSGGEPKLYALDTLGNLLRVLRIRNATNIDWEEITRDEEGNIYVGDFGNNANIRKEMVIYKIRNPSGIKETEVNAEMIAFSYPEQDSFPAPDRDKHYDVEAMIINNDSLFLFTKCRTAPFSGICRLYALPAKPGKYQALLKDSIMTLNDHLYSGWVTGAALSPQKDKLVLISGNHLWLFTSFKGNDFFKGRMQHFDFPMSQKESVCFSDECSIYITDELFLKIGQKLYKGNVCENSSVPYVPSQGKVVYDSVQQHYLLQYLLPSAYDRGYVELYGPDYSSQGTISLKQHQGEVTIKKNAKKKTKYLRICAGNECGRLFGLD